MIEFIEEVGTKSEPLLVEVAFDQVQEVVNFLNSIRTADDHTAMFRLSELRQLEMTTANWNVMGIASRVVLYGHSTYPDVAAIVQQKGGIGLIFIVRLRMSKRTRPDAKSGFFSIDFKCQMPD